jgi:hypothetical protein
MHGDLTMQVYLEFVSCITTKVEGANLEVYKRTYFGKNKLSCMLGKVDGYSRVNFGYYIQNI